MLFRRLFLDIDSPTLITEPFLYSLFFLSVSTRFPEAGFLSVEQHYHKKRAKQKWVQTLREH